jgi:hypothetical protein
MYSGVGSFVRASTDADAADRQVEHLYEGARGVCSRCSDLCGLRARAPNQTKASTAPAVVVTCRYRPSTGAWYAKDSTAAGLPVIPNSRHPELPSFS